MDPSSPNLNTQPTAYQKEVASNLGNLPFVYYNGMQIDVQNIDTFKMYYKSGMPHLSLIFYDTLNLMKDQVIPLDDSKIKIFINPKSNQLKEILIQFKIKTFNVDGGVYSITGVLDNNLLNVMQYKSYPSMTSHKALQSIARECGLGFNTNIDDTNDQMTWINTGNYVYDFIEEIVENSYKSDSAFLSYYIDYYYNLNLVDIAKELERNVDDQLGINDKSTAEAFGIDGEEKLTPLLLSNDYSMVDTNTYFESYKIINNSTQISLNSGYKNVVKYYDELQKDFLVFNLEAITHQQPDKIILKGQPQDNNFFDLNVNTYYLGKFDSDNVHKNYNYAIVQNDKNLYDLQKIVLEVIMKNPNYAIYKYQKIKLFVSNQISTPSADLINNRLSGDWLIMDIEYNYSNRKYTQKLKLIKRELELSKTELDDEAPIDNPPPVSIENTTNNETAVETNTNLPPSGNTFSATTNSIVAPNSILTKQIWRQIYTGKVNPKVIEIMYEPMINLLESYNMNTPQRITSFLSQVNIESNFLQTVQEITSGTEYNNRADLGNNSIDGPNYIKRGLIKILGKNQYKKAGELLNLDFVNNPSLVSSDNKTHLMAAETKEQLNNSIAVSIIYWLNISSWGNLNNYADNLDINYDIITMGNVPNTDSEASLLGYKSSLNDNYSTTFNDVNLKNFTSISLGINGYNGLKDKIDNWNQLRKYFI